jgi:hypothetical protein
LKVVETVMFACINISNADDLRPLLERSKVPLIGSSPNLRLLIPKVQYELERPINELVGMMRGIALL